MADQLDESIISLGFDLWSMKLYWVAISALWVFDYFLTLESEVKYGWKGKKTTVFWFFVLNRYLAPCFIIITLVAYFAEGWDLGVYVYAKRSSLSQRLTCCGFSCARYGFMETLETMLLTFTAEVFLTLRVFALLKQNKAVPVVSAIIIGWQWAIALYAMSQSSQGTDQPALLLSRRDALPGLPALPNTDAYHICIFISVLTLAPWVEAFLCLSLAFDCLAFLAILYAGFMASRRHHFSAVLRVIYRDGVVYFFVLFSSNLVWLLLVLHARPGLKFMHNQPAMIISSIMINRITLNLKEASSRQSIFTWSTQTFRQFDFDSGSVGSEGTELRLLRTDKYVGQTMNT